MLPMESKKPIVYVLGVPGQAYLAEAMAREFDRPVIGLTNYGRIEENLTPEMRAVFDDIRSFPDFYLEQFSILQNMPDDEFDREFKKLEEDLEIENNTLLIHYDRALRWVPDYKKVRIFQFATMQFIQKFLNEVEPAFILDGVTTYMQLALREVCRKKNIPYPMTEGSRINDFINISQADGRYISMQETFHELQKGNLGAMKKDALEEADKVLKEFLTKPERPAYALRNSALKFDIVPILKRLFVTLHPSKLFPSRKIVMLDRAMNYELTPLAYIKNGLVGKCRRFIQKLLKVFDATPDLNKPYFYLPLHFAPENSDIYFGTSYDHHAGFVSQLAKHIPSDCQLYVKEHPSMAGRRPTTFYKELNELFNVRMIDPSVSTFDLIQKSRAVVTVTGTAGWEAYLLGKPVIVLGTIFYNFLPSVLYAQIDDDFAVKIKDYLENLKPDEQERQNAFRAFYESCFAGTCGDIGQDTPAEKTFENADMVAQAIRTAFEEWGHTIHGNIPDEIIKKTA